MSEVAASIEFVPVDIDMAEDPKVSALLDDLSDGDAGARMAAYGRLVSVLQRIYHDGFYLAYGRFERRKLAKDLGLSPEDMDAFIEACIDCEIFDAGMFELGVLTSRGIQRRYFRAKKQGKQAVPEEDAQYIIEPGGAPAASGALRESPRSSETRRESPRCPENRREAPRSPGNRREAPRSAGPSEVKGSKGKRSEDDDARAGARSASSSAGPDGKGALPPVADTYPLACLSTVYDEAGAYFDDEGEAFPTPWDALVSTHAHRTRGQPIEGFARQVASLCPRGCDRSLGRVEACGRLLSRALTEYDPARSPNPFPLAAKIIRDERGDPA